MVETIIGPEAPELTGPLKLFTLAKAHLLELVTGSTNKGFYALEGIPEGADIVEYWLDHNDLLHVLVGHPSFPVVTVKDTDEMEALNLTLVPLMLTAKDVDHIKRIAGLRSSSNLVSSGGRALTTA